MTGNMNGYLVHNEFLVHVLNIKMAEICRFKDKIGD